MKEKGGAFKKLASDIAKKRGYKANKGTGLYEAPQEKAA
jgi:hypothetical protein